MTDALFVVSEEGYWGEECIEPLETLSDGEIEITVATPSGSPPVIDETSIDPETVGEETAEHVREVHEGDERLNDPVPIAETSPRRVRRRRLPRRSRYRLGYQSGSPRPDAAPGDSRR